MSRARIVLAAAVIGGGVLAAGPALASHCQPGYSHTTVYSPTTGRPIRTVCTPNAGSISCTICAEIVELLRPCGPIIACPTGTEG